MASRHRGPLRVFRVADVRYPIFDGTGAMLHGARWNSSGRRVIYAASTYAGALLEILVHASGNLPRNQVYIAIDIPAGVSIERIGPEDVPGWNAASFEASRAYGNGWYDERRSAVLLVPSVVTHVEHNVLINQEHADFGLITATSPSPVIWDDRLWTR